MNIEAQLLEETASSQTLIVTFSHIDADGKLAPFCFVDSIRQYPVNRMFVRDLRKKYYLQGIDGTANSVEKTADLLKTMIDDYGSQKSIFIGNSSGAN